MILLILLLTLFSHALCVPFVTKRVSLHNPITGWRPLRRPLDPMTSSETTEVTTATTLLDDHFLTVPVAVETDAEHVLSESDLNAIRERVIDNWRQQPIRSESFPHLKPFLTKLLPKPEIERETGNQRETGSPERREEKDEELTFVRMEAKNSSENLFHAYFASKDHVPQDGYVRMSRDEFKQVFKNAEILFV